MKEKYFDGTYRIYKSAPAGFSDDLVFMFTLSHYPTISSLEKIRKSMVLSEDTYVTLEFKAYEVDF